MLQLTYEELMLITGTLSIIQEDSRMIAADRSAANTKEYREKARSQVKMINTIRHKLDKELDIYPNAKPFSIIHSEF
jgi:hypothetical protein